MLFAFASAHVARIPTPAFDWHAFAPDLVLVATMVVVLVADLVLPDRESWRTSSITAVGLLGALIPIATLAHSRPRARRCSAARTSSVTTRWR